MLEAASRRLACVAGTPSNAAANRRASSGPLSLADAKIEAREEDAARSQIRGRHQPRAPPPRRARHNRATFCEDGATASTTVLGPPIERPLAASQPRASACH